MKKLIAATAAALFAVTTFAGTADAQTQPTGVWRNPRNTVHVRIQPCGREMCGTVVWASARAQQKARAAGTQSLVGAQLFRELRREDSASWAGRVFVPDLQRTVPGRLRVRGPNAVEARGCVAGGLVCRSQTWTRVS
jgi:uncharacterized protein (DUF2147 family)